MQLWIKFGPNSAMWKDTITLHEVTIDGQWFLMSNLFDKFLSFSLVMKTPLKGNSQEFSNRKFITYFSLSSEKNCELTF